VLTGWVFVFFKSQTIIQQTHVLINRKFPYFLLYYIALTGELETQGFSP